MSILQVVYNVLWSKNHGRSTTRHFKNKNSDNSINKTELLQTDES